MRNSGKNSGERPKGQWTDARHREGEGKKKEDRPPWDIIVLLRVTIYAYMEGVYSSRGIARACRQNINFMTTRTGGSFWGW
jgi:hypothetical protein